MSYLTKLNQLVELGYSIEYIEAKLWAEFSREHSILKISDDVANAVSKQSK